MKKQIKIFVSVLLSMMIVVMTASLGFATDIPDMSEFHDYNQFTLERNETLHSFERNQSTAPDAVTSPVLSNGSYDFYELTSNWSSSDGSISWNDRSQILTLNNAYISSYSSNSDNFGIYVPHNSTIVLVGDNTVISGASGSGEYDSIGIICNGNLNFEGSGSLYVKGGKSSRNSYGILARYDVNIKDCEKIEAIGSYASQFSAGFSSESGNVSLSNTEFIGTGGESYSGSSVGFDCVSSFTVNNSSVEGYASSSALNWGIYAGKLVANNSYVTGVGGDVPSNSGSASIYCSYGIYIDESSDAKYSDFVANGGNISKSGNGSASYGLACQGNFGATGCRVTADGGESVNTSYSVFIGGKCIMYFCDVFAVTKRSKKAIAFSASNIYFNGGVYQMGCDDAEESASALHATGYINIEGGEVLADSQCGNNVFAISADKIGVFGGRIVARASESNGSSCGIYGNVSICCGDGTATGEDSAFDGNIDYIADNCKITASEKHFSEDMSDGALSSGKIKVPSAGNVIAKTARIYFDMNGQTIYAYTLEDNLSYRGKSVVFAHCENPRVMFIYESMNSSVIKVENSIFGIVKAVNSGTATIEVTATDLVTGEPVRDADGNIASATVEIKCTMTFWEKIVRFFRNLFGLD